MHYGQLENSECEDHALQTWFECFSNSLIIHEDKTKDFTFVKEVWIYDPNYHKSW